MASGIHKYTVQEAQNASMGQAGAEFISDNVARTGSFVAIQCLEDTIFNALTPEDTVKGFGVGTYGTSNTMASETISAGTTIYGKWTAIDLTSGLVIAYIG